MKPHQDIPDLTAIRACLAGWVFIYHVDLQVQFSHSLGPAGTLIRHGYLGVDGFFILSGLILARVHPEFANATLPSAFAMSWRFWGRRLARIYPVHLAVLMLLAGVIAIGTAGGLTARDPLRFGSGALVQNLLLIQAWGLSNHWAWNYPSWSISTEWAGYLLFPALWFGLARCPPIVGGQFIILSFPVLGLIAYVSGNTINLAFADSLWRFFPEFILGMSTALMIPIAADAMPTAKFPYAGLAFIALGLASNQDAICVLGIWTILAGLALHADAERPAMLRWRILHPLGRLSYAYYMSFATIELLLTQAFRHAGTAPQSHKLLFAAVMTAATFGLASLLHTLIEVPARKWADRKLMEPLPAAAHTIGPLVIEHEP